MTEEQKQWVCERAGFKYVIDEGCLICGNIGRKLSCGHKTVKVFPEIDLNILMQAVENINQNMKHTFVLISGNCVCVEMHFPANMVKAQHREYFDYNKKIPLTEALKQALIYIKEND